MQAQAEQASAVGRLDMVDKKNQQLAAELKESQAKLDCAQSTIRQHDKVVAGLENTITAAGKEKVTAMISVGQEPWL